MEEATLSALSKGLNFAACAGESDRCFTRANEALTVLPVNKGTATVILNTTDYIKVIHAMLEDQV
jgi:hypothetical protein